jgi:leucyl aminopeptidase
MNILFQNKKLNQIKADCEIVFVVNKKLKHKWIRDKKELDQINFKGDEGEISFLQHKNRLYLGIDSLGHNDLREGAAFAIRYLAKTKVKSIKIGTYSGEDLFHNTKAMVEGFLLGGYSFQEYKSKKVKNQIRKIIIAGEDFDKKTIDNKRINEAIKIGQLYSLATNLTRDLVNQTPSDVTPLTLTKKAKEIAKENKLEIKVLGEKQIEKEGMGAFLAVSKASPYPPQLIHLMYKPKESKKKIIFVGKGLTFDSGGLNVKPGQYMSSMKSDMSGAGTILGVMSVVSKLEFPYEIHGIIGATENVISGLAYKPDDVLCAKNGKTIEIKNTDAEGRLVLADCLCYAQESKSDYIIDIATLTGACIVALGEYTLGILGYNNELKKEFNKAASLAGEFSAELPFNKYLSKLIKSEVADINNTSSSDYGGAITAGLFLGEFIEKKYKEKWIHLDIAGPSYIQKEWGYNPFGASGAGVRLCLEWLNIQKSF